VAKVIILGSSFAIPDENHENTHLLILGEDRTILIDCANQPTLRLERVGVDHEQITDIVLTHFHPDHVSGLPSLLMNTWLMGRDKALDIYGLPHTLERTEKMMEFYDWETWPNFFPVSFNNIEDGDLTLVLESSDLRILASPVRHIIPTIGLRFEFLSSGKVLAYSCDTEPCNQVVELARGADMLLHESSGAVFGHSSAFQAGEMATRAEAKALYLIHYPTGKYTNHDLVAEAQKSFRGPVYLAEDFMELDF